MNNEPRIYIASKTKHADKWIALRASGVNIISTWIDEAGAGETVSMELLAAKCIYQSKECDAMIVYREFDDYLKGAFIEMGIAITYPLKPIILVGPVLPPGSVFTHLPNVFAADSIDEAIAAIRKNHRPVAPTKEASTGQAGTTVEDDWVRVEAEMPYQKEFVLVWAKREYDKSFSIYRAYWEQWGENKQWMCYDLREDENIEVKCWKKITEPLLISPTPTTDKVEEEIKRHSDTWDESFKATFCQRNGVGQFGDRKKTYLEKLENKLRKI